MCMRMPARHWNCWLVMCLCIFSFSHLPLSLSYSHTNCCGQTVYIVDAKYFHLEFAAQHHRSVCDGESHWHDTLFFLYKHLQCCLHNIRVFFSSLSPGLSLSLSHTSFFPFVVYMEIWMKSIKRKVNSNHPSIQKKNRTRADHLD